MDTTERLHFHFSLSCIGEGNGNLLQCSCLENPRDGGAWLSAIYGVVQSQTRLKRLSSSSSSSTIITTDYRTFVFPTWNSVPLNTNSSFHYKPQLLATTILLFVSMNQTSNWFKWNHKIFVLLWLVNFIQNNVFKVHPCWRMCQPFLGWIIIHNINTPYFVYPLSHQ